MKTRINKKINILLLTLMLACSGCAKEEPEPIPQEIIQEDIENENTTTYTEAIDLRNIDRNKIIFLNNPDEYRQYLSEPEPSYSLLYETIKNNNKISKKYKDVLTTIVNLFEFSNISPSNLAIFYENLKRESVNTDYEVDKSKDDGVAAFFQTDPDNPSINIDESFVDFYTILHEVIHSCHETMIRYEDKIIVITTCAINKTYIDENTDSIELYGMSFVEGQAEYISNHLYRSNKRLFTSAYSYNINNSVLEFLIDTMEIDFDTFFSFNVNDFEESLTYLEMPEEDIENIIYYMDILLANGKEVFLNKDVVRQYFFYTYVPRLVEYYIKSGLTTDQIYSQIGYSLKTSVIEKILDENTLEYRSTYLSIQKQVFDEIEVLLNETLTNHNMATSSIYYYIGHEFGIYYSLYGDESTLTNDNFYLAHNWDNIATKNCKILLYADGEEIKMCSYAENQDGSLSCYDYKGEITNIKKGVKLKDLLNMGIINIENGCIKYNYSVEKVIDILNSYEIDCITDNETALLASDRCLYLDKSTGNIEYANVTTNESGEEIPYQIFASQINLVPENAQKIGSIKELYEVGIIKLDINSITIDATSLANYINNPEDNTQKVNKTR